MFNSAQSHQINHSILDKSQSKTTTIWTPFSVQEFKSSITKYSDILTLELDELLWRHLKVIINDITYLNNFINIASTYINLEHWPLHFKTLFSIIISKPNKTSYNTPKMFQPIILLNMLGKLIEKVISERLQFQSIF